MKWRVPDQEVDQKKLGERLWKKDCQARKSNREDAMDRKDGGSSWGMINDHDRCEWVNVSSGTGSQTHLTHFYLTGIYQDLREILSPL